MWWKKVLIVLLSLNVVRTKQNVIKFDEEILNKLEILSSTLSSYDQFESFNKYQCAIECFKDKNTCTGYSFDDRNNTCSLFEDSTKIMDNYLIEMVKYCLVFSTISFF
jgi:hypothetical protein